MSFNELIMTIESENDAFDKLFNNCVLFSEACYNEYKVNLKEAELKVLQESGTTDDLIYLESQAKEGFIVKAAKTIKKMIDSLIAWLGKLIESIKKFFTGKKTKESLDKVENIIKENPKLKSEKINVPDVDKIAKTYGKYEAAVNRKLAMVKGKKFSEKDLRDLDEIQKNCEKEISIAKKATVAISITAALALVSGGIVAILDNTKKNVEDNKNIKFDKNSTSEDIENNSALIAYICRLAKGKGTDLSNAIKDIFDSIKGKVTKSGKANVDTNFTRKEEDKKDEVKKESVEDTNSYINNLLKEIEESAMLEAASSESIKAEEYLEMMVSELFNNDDVIEESANSDIKNEYKKFSKELKLLNKKINESLKNHKFNDARKYVDEVSNLITDTYNKIDSIESTDKDANIAIIYHFVKYIIAGVIGSTIGSTISFSQFKTVPTASSLMITYGIGLGTALVQSIVDVIKKVKKLEDMDTNDKEKFNIYKVKILDTLKFTNDVYIECMILKIKQEKDKYEITLKHNKKENINIKEAEEYLDVMVKELFTESKDFVAEEYLATLESELFNNEENDEVMEESENITAEEYLTMLESELFNDKDDEVMEESVDERIERLSNVLSEIESLIE